jgi:hypothetical protein
MAKKPDPVQAKAARQKKIVIVGGVLLLGLLAFQVPRTLKMLHGSGTVTTSASTTSAGAVTTPGSNPLAPPTLAGGSAAAGSSSSSPSGSSRATSSDGVQDPSVPLPPSSGQLVSFSLFKSKDPFQQQICSTGSCASASAGGAAPSGAASSSSSSGSSSRSGGGTGTSAGRGSSTFRSSSTGSTSSAQKVTSATLSVNGTVETVSIGKSFPAAAPVFLLVSASAKDAMIGIAGGSLQNGAGAVDLRMGKTLTLQNTADGMVYALKLLRTA